MCAIKTVLFILFIFFFLLLFFFSLSLSLQFTSPLSKLVPLFKLYTSKSDKDRIKVFMCKFSKTLYMLIQTISERQPRTPILCAFCHLLLFNPNQRQAQRVIPNAKKASAATDMNKRRAQRYTKGDRSKRRAKCTKRRVQRVTPNAKKGERSE